jgi:NADH:ubiquinone oxidoreductase subunit 6 (subunit J)
MRIQTVLVIIVTLIMAAVMAVGTVYTDQFPQASQAQSAGFDALAHDLFDDLFGSDEGGK